MLNHLSPRIASPVTRTRQLAYLMKGPNGPRDARDAVWELSCGLVDASVKINTIYQVVVWNMQKNKKKSLEILENNWDTWNVNFAMVQELQLDPQMEKHRCSMFDGKSATLVTNVFMHKNGRAPSGVCTISDVSPIEKIPLLPQPLEPFGTSKPALGTLYPVEGRLKNIGLWNIHAINYVHTRDYIQYLSEVAEEMAKHDGPKIVAGDFNSWSTKRESCVSAFCKLFDLEEVEFAGPVKKFRGHALDRVLVSKTGLRITNAHAKSYRRNSDHNPLFFEVEVG